MKFPKIALTMGFMALISGTTLLGCVPNSNSDNGAVQAQQSLYDRVMKEGKIRCGYIPYAPGLIKDPNTGEFSGIFFSTVEEVAKNLELEVEWTEEVGWGSMIEGLLNNRYDAICSPVWANSSRARLADFSDALFFSGIGIYVRQDDNRFNDGYEAINSENITIATIDGEMSDIIAQSNFPKAKRVSLPQTGDVSQLLLNVAESKADVTFVEPFFGAEFLENNPSKVINIAEQKPIRVFGNTVMFNRGEHEFKAMFNTALNELINSGFVEELVDQYSPFPGAFYMPAAPYQPPKKQE